MKLFHWPDAGNHVVMIVRGHIDVSGFEQIAQEAAKVCRPLAHCKVIIDLQDGTYRLELEHIHAFVRGLKPDVWPVAHRIALVSSSELNDYDQLLLLRNVLSKHGCNVAAFRDPKVATSWLADPV